MARVDDQTSRLSDAQSRPSSATVRRSLPSLMASGFLATALGAALNVAFIGVLLRRFDTDVAGLVVVTIAVQMVGVRFADLGATTASVRFLSIAVHGGGQPRRADVVRIYACGLLPLALVTSALAAAGMALAPRLGRLLAADQAEQMAGLVRVAGASLPLLAVYLVLVHSLKGWQAFTPYRVIERISRPAAFLLIALASGPGTSPTQLMTRLQIATACCLALVVVVVVRLIGQLPRRPAPAHGHSSLVHDLGEFWRFGLPRGWNVILDAGLAYFDTILISAVLGPAPAGIYTAASRVLMLYAFCIDAGSEVGGPRIAAAAAVRDRDAVFTAFGELARLQARLVWPAASFLVVFAEPVLTRLQPELVDGIGAAQWILVATIIAAPLGPVAVAAVMLGRASRVLGTSLLALVVNVAANLLLLESFGIAASGFAWGVSIIVTAVGCHVACGSWRLWSSAVQTSVRDAGRFLALPLVCFAGLRLMGAATVVEPFLLLALVAAAVWSAETLRSSLARKAA
jgi:O-antigen/teichoic acid export membrane protein